MKVHAKSGASQGVSDNLAEELDNTSPKEKYEKIQHELEDTDRHLDQYEEARQAATRAWAKLKSSADYYMTSAQGDDKQKIFDIVISNASYHPPDGLIVVEDEEEFKLLDYVAERPSLNVTDISHIFNKTANIPTRKIVASGILPVKHSLAELARNFTPSTAGRIAAIGNNQRATSTTLDYDFTEEDDCADSKRVDDRVTDSPPISAGHERDHIWERRVRNKKDIAGDVTEVGKKL